MKLLVSVAAGVLAAGLGAVAQDSYHMVDMRVGTAHDGQTSPFVGPPFSMTAWIPQTQATEKKCVAPYYDRDKVMSGIQGSHWMSGSCTQEYGSFSVMPVTGDLGDLSPEGRGAEFRHEDEVMEPAYYSVMLPRYKTKVEVTATTRVGFLRFTFPAGEKGTVVLEPNVKVGQGFVEVRPDGKTIVGYNPVTRIYQGSGQSAGFSGYFVARFDRPFVGFGTGCGKGMVEGAKTKTGGCPRLVAYATFAASAKPLLVKVGTSFVSLEEAEKNLDAEIPGWDFAAVRRATEATWKTFLSRIVVEGGTEDQRKTFYTAFYHSGLGPRPDNDVDGTYNGFAQEGKLHTVPKGRNYYDDFSMWDTFRAVHPLMTLLDPAKEEDMVQSMVLKGEQGGFMPIFPMWNSYTSEMVGDHPVSLMADAISKGLTHFDVQSAYRLVRQNAMDTPSYDEYKNGKGRRALEDYKKLGYVPLENPVKEAFHQGEQVSRTLEYAYDDEMVSIVAKYLGKTDDAAMFHKRSENWRNVIDPETGFARGRHADGTWISPFNPAKSTSYTTESNPWIYTFFVPQNPQGMIEAEGGREKFIARLDGLFDKNLYDQGNEPSHHIPYLYDAAGAAWKTQERIRAAMALYNDSPGGEPGNDDDGQMSAWYVLSAMGFYQVCPGYPEYWIGSPIFDKATLHVPGGKEFTIVAKNNSAANKYIQSATLNGRPFTGYLLRHADIVKGGVLVFEMGSVPVK